MVEVRLFYDDDGYVVGWGSDYNEDNVVELEQSELDSLVIGATKLVDGHLVIDEEKRQELIDEANKTEPTEQDKINEDLSKQLEAAQQQNSELQSALLELSDIVLSGGLS